MTSLNELKQSAEQSAAFRKHILAEWIDNPENTSSYATCALCGLVATVCINPPANGIDVSGSAVAVNCEGIEYRSCKACKGTGRSEFLKSDCLGCHGTGKLPKPDSKAIVAAIRGRKGLRSKPPADDRAYYVWRMARFHGGKDVTMPVVAGIRTYGDPWLDYLDAIAELVAKRVYGTGMAAAYRWAGALGHEVNVPDGQPATAYHSGPTHDSSKPDFELPETW